MVNALQEVLPPSPSDKQVAAAQVRLQHTQCASIQRILHHADGKLLHFKVFADKQTCV